MDAPAANPGPAPRRWTIELLLAAAICLMAFAAIGEGIDGDQFPASLDFSIRDSWHEFAHGHPTLTSAAAGFTQLGYNRVRITAAIVVAGLLCLRRHWRLAAIWLLFTLGGIKFIELLKTHYARPRPAFLEPIVHEASPSFPSGHAGGSALFCALLAYVLLRLSRRLGLALSVPLMLWAALMGLSRIYLGAHWFSDVVGGWLFGLGWAALGMAVAEMLKRRAAGP
jgi:undecaprenyl-diphosphatase